MSDNVKILITASINKGLSIGEINRKISEIAKSPNLQKIKIKLDIDNKIIQTIQSFNKNINQTTKANVAQSKSINEATSALQKETQAINQQTEALQKNETMRKKITTSEDRKTTATTTGNKFNNTTKTETVTTAGEIITKPTIQNINLAGMAAARQKLLDAEKKAAYSYEKFWQNALTERESKEKRFYDSQLSRINKSKQALSSVGNNKAADVLARQYDKVIQKMQSMQSSGKVLTEQDISGFNRRIERIIAYTKAQKQLESKTKQLTSIANSAEKQVTSLTGRFGSKINTTSLNELLKRIKDISPASRTAIADANKLKNEITQLGASATSSGKKVLTLRDAFSTAMTKFPINKTGGSKTS